MNNWLVALFCVLSVLAGIVAGRIWERWRYNRKIQKLNLTLDAIMHGDLSPDWSPYQEGELSILVSQLELLVKRTAHMVNQLNAEKGTIHDFIADISHQIKTPLTGLLSYLDLLERAETDSDKKEQLADCIYLAERMNELVRMLLELAKLDSGSVRLRIENVQAEELIRAAEQAALAARPQAEGCFSINVEDGLMLRCDRKWFQQALVNVLVNALDYSPAGAPVQITIKQSGGVMLLKVLDYSGGVAEEDLPHIFKRFYRAKGSKKDGFGIGLSMAESIVGLHNGHLRAVNEGDGLAMLFTLPLLPCAEHYENCNLTTS